MSTYPLFVSQMLHAAEEDQQENNTRVYLNVPFAGSTGFTAIKGLAHVCGHAISVVGNYEVCVSPDDSAC